MFVPLSFADPSSALGRLDHGSLSHQTLMEMVFAGVTNRDRVCGSLNDPLPIHEWTKITVHETCVIRIEMYGRQLTGSVALEWLPSTIYHVVLSKNGLVGSVNLEGLPSSLKHLSMSVNALTGSLILDKLPETLKYLNLQLNKFSGSVNLTKLPKEMTGLCICLNQLSGPLDLTALPATLEDLDLSQNSFSGETDFSKIPDSLTDLNVAGNEDLSGEICDFDQLFAIFYERSKVKYVRQK